MRDEVNLDCTTEDFGDNPDPREERFVRAQTDRLYLSDLVRKLDKNDLPEGPDWAEDYFSPKMDDSQIDSNEISQEDYTRYHAFLEDCAKKGLRPGPIIYNRVPVEREILDRYFNIGAKTGLSLSKMPAWRVHKRFNQKYLESQRKISKS